MRRLGKRPTLWAISIVAACAVPLIVAFAMAGEEPSAKSNTYAAEETKKQITFAEHIGPFIHNNCTVCHRKGQVAPFPLITYRDVQKRAQMLRDVMEMRLMPPWPPAHNSVAFLDERNLSDAQIELFSDWVESGMAEGDPAKLPPLPEFPSGWLLGEPDRVIEMPLTYTVAPEGPDIYRNFVLPVEADGDLWIRAIEIKPSSAAVHHVILFLDSSGRSRQVDAQDPEPGFPGMAPPSTGNLETWAVGATPRFLPRDYAKLLRKGTDIVMQVHLHPSGKEEIERTQVGLHLTDKPPSKSFLTFMSPPAFSKFADIDIPPGDPNYKLTETFPVPIDMELLMIGGHAHYLGKSVKAWATLPNGEKQDLLHIPEWDLNWQGRYAFKNPVKLPKGSLIDMELVYDNSADNPRNPYDPPQRVTFGIASEDEMGFVIMNAVPEREEDAAVFERAKQAWSNYGFLLQRLLQQDANKDKRIEMAEADERLQMGFGQFDRNKDGALDLQEMRAVALNLSGYSAFLQ